MSKQRDKAALTEALHVTVYKSTSALGRASSLMTCLVVSAACIIVAKTLCHHRIVCFGTAAIHVRCVMVTCSDSVGAWRFRVLRWMLLFQVGRALLVSVLDLEGCNPWSRLSSSCFGTVQNLRTWMIATIKVCLLLYLSQYAHPVEAHTVD